MTTVNKRNPLFPSLKRGGYSCRIMFRDEARGERYFDSEWSATAVDANQFTLERAMSGDRYTETKAIDTIGKSLRVGDVVMIRPRRWTPRSVACLPAVTILIDGVEVQGDRLLVTFDVATAR